MIKTLEKSGHTVDEALHAALTELGIDPDDVMAYEHMVVQRPKSGFLGIGAVPAIVRVSYEVKDEAPAHEKPAVKPEPAQKSAEPHTEKKPVKNESKPAPRPEKKQQPAPVSEVKTAEAPAAEPAVSADESADYAAIRSFLTGLLERMGVKADMEISPRDNGGINVKLSGNGMGAIIGRRGETLDAIQHLTNYVVNRGSDKHMHISVDAENYRSKREESLTHLAEKMAEKAIRYKQSMALEPMNSYERHVIHTALQNYEGVTTSSTGVEPNRRVVVSYVRPEKPGNKPQSREWA